MFPKILLDEGGESSDVLLFSEFNIYSGSVKKVEKAELQNRFDDTKIVIRSVHDLHDSWIIGYRKQRLANCKDELLALLLLAS